MIKNKSNSPLVGEEINHKIKVLPGVEVVNKKMILDHGVELRQIMILGEVHPIITVEAMNGVQRQHLIMMKQIMMVVDSEEEVEVEAIADEEIEVALEVVLEVVIEVVTVEDSEEVAVEVEEDTTIMTTQIMITLIKIVKPVLMKLLDNQEDRKSLKNLL